MAFPAPWDVAARVACATKRLVTYKSTGQDEDDLLGTATGFFFAFSETEIALVTNAHVVKDADRVTTFIHRGDRLDRFETCELPMDRWVVLDEVDLCGALVTDLLAWNDRGHVLIQALDEQSIPSVEELKQLPLVNEVLVVGYPQGAYDSTHALPLCIRGITASHPAIPFAGARQFAVDALLAVGSSGSPVILRGFTETQHGGFEFRRSSARLLGVLTEFQPVGCSDPLDLTTEDGRKIPVRTGYRVARALRSDAILDLGKKLGVRRRTKRPVIEI
jgi:hypothetical protein